MMKSVSTGASATVLTVVALVGLACNGNTQEQRDVASKAADEYCECTLELSKLPPEELAAKPMAGLCASQQDAWNAAWEGLPDRAAGDDKAMAISEYYGKCFSLMSDSYMAAGRK